MKTPHRIIRLLTCGPALFLTFGPSASASGPELSVAFRNADEVVLSWPATAADYVVEATSWLSATSVWAVVPMSLEQAGAVVAAALPAGVPGARFTDCGILIEEIAFSTPKAGFRARSAILPQKPPPALPPPFGLSCPPLPGPPA